MALRRSGVVVIAPTTLHIYAIETAPLRDAARVGFIFNAVEAILGSHKNITRCTMEGGAYEAGGRLFQLGGSFAVVQLACLKSTLPLDISPPMLLKKFFTGNHESDKTAMRRTANTLHPQAAFTDKEEDEVDAFALAYMSLLNEHRKLIHKRSMLEAVTKLETHDMTDHPATLP